MNIFVTGATGFIGSHLCRELIRRGHRVSGLTRSGRIDSVKSLLPCPEFHLETGDIRDAGMMHSIVKNNRAEVIFHLAAQLPDDDGVENPFVYFETNAKGTLNLLDAAYLNGVDKFIYASSMSVYSEPPRYLPVDESHPTQPSTMYSVAKLVGELCCNLYSKVMNIVVLRYSGAYGQGERTSNAMPRFIDQALNNRPITIYGNGRQTSDFVYIKDVFQGTLLVLEKDRPGVYNIGSGEEIGVRDLAKRITDFTNSKSEIVLTDKDTERPFRFVLDIAKSREDLGYSPHSFDAGLGKYIKEYNIEV